MKIPPNESILILNVSKNTELINIGKTTLIISNSKIQYPTKILNPKTTTILNTNDDFIKISNANATLEGECKIKTIKDITTN